MKAIVLSLLLSAGLSQADIPSLINYQGRLTDSNGQPVTGSRSFSIAIHDAATGGNLLYTENIGAITLDGNGIYSFQFGGAGTSNKAVSETVATTNGTSTMFQKVLTNLPVVAGSVQVSDGTYTWSQSGGSSNNDDFGGNFSTALNRITVNYFNGPPATGRTITVNYQQSVGGIGGALESSSQHWMAITIDGVTQGARQRVLAVPFAMRAGTAETAGTVATSQRSYPIGYLGSTYVPISYTYTGVSGGTNGYPGSVKATRSLEKNISSVQQVQGNVVATRVTSGSSQTWGFAALRIWGITKTGVKTLVAGQEIIEPGGALTLAGPVTFDHSTYDYQLEVEVGCRSNNANWGGSPAGASASLNSLEIKASVIP